MDCLHTFHVSFLQEELKEIMNHYVKLVKENRRSVIDVFYISGQDAFQELLNREDLDICLVNEFKLKYGNPE